MHYPLQSSRSPGDPDAFRIPTKEVRKEESISQGELGDCSRKGETLIKKAER